MQSTKSSIQERLNAAAIIVRKYNLGGIHFFFNRFSTCNKTQLEAAWFIAQRKIQNREIIKDALQLSAEESKEVHLKLQAVKSDNESLYKYLHNEFDVRKFKLQDEKVERRVRASLAIKYLEIQSADILNISKNEKTSLKTKTSSFKSKFKVALIILAIAGAMSIPRIISGLSSVETLTVKIHEQSKYNYRVGATCRDGWHSEATGRGACSHHGGVADWIYETAYHKTLEECAVEAQKLSWRD